MKKSIIFATTNEGKMKEIKEIFESAPYDVISMKEALLDVKIEETGTTFEENAMIKARTIMEITGQIVLADDSGLEIDALNKAPGIYSARYLGETTSYEYKNQYILDQLEKVMEERRTARYVCAIACAFPTGRVITKRATVEGRIAYKAVGSNGFGYDPIFYVPEFKKTMAELTMEEKNQISHRAKALNMMKQELILE